MIGPAAALLEQRLRRLLLLRVVMVTTLLLIAAYVEAVSETLRPVNPLYLVIAATYGLSVVHALALRYLPRLDIQAYAQVVGDILTITALVYVTVTRPGFTLLYPISVLSGAVLLYRRGGLILAGVATSCYAILIFLVRTARIPPEGLFDVPFLTDRTLLYSVFVVAVTCFTVGLTGSYLSEGLRSAGQRLEEAAEEVADLRELNELIVGSIHSGLLTVDGTGHVLYVNDFGAQILGGRGPDLSGRRLREIFPTPLLGPAALDARADDATLHRLELPYLRPDGRRLELGLSVSRLAKPGRGHLVVFQDLTEIKRLENEGRANEKLAAMGEMAAQLAHEIRNPLGSISGSAQVLMEDTAIGPQQERLLAIITRESQRLSDTLGRFLVHARKPARPPQPVDVASLVEEAVTLLRNAPEVSPSHRVEFSRDPGAGVALVDPDQIVQVFWNLARNGLEAMPGGGVLGVLVRATGTDVILSVRDEGLGMTREEQQRIFEPFHSGRPHGTGLGLAIVYAIVREHGGDVTVRSAPTRGTEVEVRLRRLPAA